MIASSGRFSVNPLYFYGVLTHGRHNLLRMHQAGVRIGCGTDAGVPIVGDDIKSQVGATITHRVLAKLFEDRDLVSAAVVDGDGKLDEAEFTADLTALDSDRRQRNGAIQRALATTMHPDAAFVLTEPVTLDAVPPIGEAIEAQAARVARTEWRPPIPRTAEALAVLAAAPGGVLVLLRPWALGRTLGVMRSGHPAILLADDALDHQFTLEPRPGLKDRFGRKKSAAKPSLHIQGPPAVNSPLGNGGLPGRKTPV